MYKLRKTIIHSKKDLINTIFLEMINKTNCNFEQFRFYIMDETENEIVFSGDTGSLLLNELPLPFFLLTENIYKINTNKKLK